MAKGSTTDGEESLEGRTAHASDGAKIGKLEEVYLDQQTDRPSWGVVKTGHVGGRPFVPLSDACSDGDDVRLGVTKNQIKDAPQIREDEHLSPDVESRLRSHYGGVPRQRALPAATQVAGGSRWVRARWRPLGRGVRDRGDPDGDHQRRRGGDRAAPGLWFGGDSERGRDRDRRRHRAGARADDRVLRRLQRGPAVALRWRPPGLRRLDRRLGDHAVDRRRGSDLRVTTRRSTVRRTAPEAMQNQRLQRLQHDVATAALKGARRSWVRRVGPHRASCLQR